MARPPTQPTNWAQTGSKIAPSAGKITAGWTVNERPPAEWINWLDNNRDLWLKFLADVTSGQPIVDLLLNFANTDVFAALIDVTVPPATTNYRLVARLKINTSMHVRIYAGSTSRRFLVVYNAVWGGSTWLADNTAQPATAFALVNDGTTSGSALELLYHPATASSWTDAAWTVGAFTSLSVKTLHVTQPTGTSTVIDANALISGGLNVVVGIDTAGTITAGGLLSADGGADFNGPVHVNAAHLYLDDSVDIVHTSPKPRRRIQIPLLSGTDWDGNIRTNYDYINGYLHTTTGADRTIEYALHPPREAENWNFEVLWMTPDITTHANAFAVFRHVRDFTLASSTPAVAENLGTRVATVFSPTFAQTASLAVPIAGPAQPYAENYYARITLKANAAGTNRLYGVAITYDDPGPRNG